MTSGKDLSPGTKVSAVNKDFGRHDLPNEAGLYDRSRGLRRRVIDLQDRDPLDSLFLLQPFDWGVMHGWRMQQSQYLHRKLTTDTYDNR